MDGVQMEQKTVICAMGLWVSSVCEPLCVLYPCNVVNGAPLLE